MVNHHEDQYPYGNHHGKTYGKFRMIIIWEIMIGSRITSTKFTERPITQVHIPAKHPEKLHVT